MNCAKGPILAVNRGAAISAMIPTNVVLVGTSDYCLSSMAYASCWEILANPISKSVALSAYNDGYLTSPSLRVFGSSGLWRFMRS